MSTSIYFLFIYFCIRIAHISARQACCPNIGCFTDDAPFSAFPLPDCASDLNVMYKMFTRNNPATPQLLTLNKIPSLFVGLRTTVFIAHGYLADAKYEWMLTLKDEFLLKADMNVVLIDWGILSIKLLYPQAASNTRSVGAHTSLIIQSLLQQPDTHPNRFWCAGHSLGSHVCGHTGMKMPPGLKLGRITGMDPAGPWFETNPDLLVGLNPTAASYVDIIHTDKALGTERTLGHIDFYPTGYELRIDLTFQSAFKVGVVCESICMHHRSIDFMIGSINGDQNCFATNVQCTSGDWLPLNAQQVCSPDMGCVAYMGYNADQSCTGTGIHYLEVRERPPFC